MAFKGFNGTTPLGEKRHLVTLTQPNTTGARDAGGAILPPTVIADGLFAAMEPWGKNPAKTENINHGEADVLTYKFIIGYMDGVTMPLSIVCEGNTYKVYAVLGNPEAPNFELWMFAQLI